MEGRETEDVHRIHKLYHRWRTSFEGALSPIYVSRSGHSSVRLLPQICAAPSSHGRSLLPLRIQHDIHNPKALPSRRAPCGGEVEIIEMLSSQFRNSTCHLRGGRISHEVPLLPQQLGNKFGDASHVYSKVVAAITHLS